MCESECARACKDAFENRGDGRNQRCVCARQRVAAALYPEEDTYTFSSLSGLALLGSCARVVVSATQACVIADFEY